MAITAAQLERYQREGFLVLKDFVAATTCDSFRARAEELVHEFDPRVAISIFSTAAQNHLRDDYFLKSGNKIRFFFEEDAFLPDGSLKQSKERSINKIGHALHELDPVFIEFSRTAAIRQLIADLGIEQPLLLQSMYISSSNRRLAAKSLAIRTARFFTLNPRTSRVSGSRLKMRLSRTGACGPFLADMNQDSNHVGCEVREK